MSKTTAKTPKKITASSTAEYFAKNLQQVGFSSPVKAVLTTLKEALDNSLDACEEHGILPNIKVTIEKKGKGALKNTDRLLIRVEDNGPGIKEADIPMVFGQYLASSKFGQGRCTRGQQGIGISAATTWAVQTTATGARVTTKQDPKKKAISCLVITDLKNNKGVITERTLVDWPVDHGTIVEFLIDGRVQLNGEAGILNYLRSNVLLNPHLSLSYNLPELEPVVLERVSEIAPVIPDATSPHPHTMNLGDFISHGRLYGQMTLKQWLLEGFSRITPQNITAIVKVARLQSTQRLVSSLESEEFKTLYETVQAAELLPPETTSVMAIGEDALSLSIMRLGEIDYFSIVTRKPKICDFKPVQVEVALARLKSGSSSDESHVQILRFANRVPLQFDKSACAIIKAISTINWKSYGLKQSKNSLPQGPYIFAISVISPFIKFKNASKETIDASDDLVSELRLTLMSAGQQLAKHLNREQKAKELESKTQHIEKFCPILVETLCRITSASVRQKARAEEGLRKILGRDSKETEKQLTKAEEKLSAHLSRHKSTLSQFTSEDDQIKHAEGLARRAEEDSEENE